MSEQRYVAAVEISSSKIIAAVGRTDGRGRLDVLAVEQMRGVESVRYGIIQNSKETASRLSNIIERLERRAEIAPRSIDSIFVGIGGRSMRSIQAEAQLRLPEETEITEKHIQDLKSQVENRPVDSSLEVVDSIPRAYMMGLSETQDPIGIIGDQIKATYDLIVCRKLLKKNINDTIKGKTNLEIAGFVVTPIAVSHLILKPEEKRLGCMLVDMGAETTTVMIFKNNHIQYYATLPLGSRNITRDIISLNILEERAEEIKKSSGCAVAPEIPSMIDLDGVPLKEINSRVVARSEEIVANIMEQIRYAGFTGNDLPGGIIAIGGGFNLSGMLDLVSTQCNMSVRRGSLPSYVSIEDPKAPAFEIIEVASVLYAGATLTDKECLSRKEQEALPVNGDDPDSGDLPPAPKPEPKKRGGFGEWLRKLKTAAANTWDDEGGDSELD